MNPTGSPPSVLVTGASTGIGLATVAAHVAAGFHVWATVRRAEDATALAARFGSAVTTAIVDVTDSDAIAALGDRIIAAGPLDALVNNAGIALPSPLEYLPLDVLRRQLEVNVVGQLAVTQAVLPALLAAPSPRIIFIGSISGRIAAPVLGAYAASKHAVAGLAGSLRAELEPYGVQVALIEPGVIATPIWERSTAAGDEVMASMPADSPRYAAQIASARRGAAVPGRGAPAEKVAAAVLHATTARRSRPRVVVGRDARLIALLVRVLPFRAVYRLVRGAA